jgi:hypothetical protein
MNNSNQPSCLSLYSHHPDKWEKPSSFFTFLSVLPCDLNKHTDKPEKSCFEKEHTYISRLRGLTRKARATFFRCVVSCSPHFFMDANAEPPAKQICLSCARTITTCWQKHLIFLIGAGAEYREHNCATPYGRHQRRGLLPGNADVPIHRTSHAAPRRTPNPKIACADHAGTTPTQAKGTWAFSGRPRKC